MGGQREERFGGWSGVENESEGWGGEWRRLGEKTVKQD